MRTSVIRRMSRTSAILVGDLYLHRNKLTIPHSGGQQMLIFRAEPGSESAQALERLQSLSTDHADRLGPF